jgi:hypothetical protein
MLIKYQGPTQCMGEDPLNGGITVILCICMPAAVHQAK